jgi:serine/threonine-protein kinase
MSDHPTQTSQDTASRLNRWEQLFGGRTLTAKRSRSDVMLVSGSAQTFAEETALLLRSRLRAYSLICLVMLCFFFALSLFTDNLLLLGVRFAILAVVAACHAFARSKRLLTPGQLRTLEMLILFSAVAQLTMMMAVRMLHYAAAGDAVNLAAVQQGYMGGWVLLVLTYGLFIPIPWRRAAALLLPVGFVPGILLYALTWVRKDMESFLAQDQSPEFALLPITAAAVAVYAAHTIYRIRETAYEGRRFGQYALIEQIGSGGMGQVYRAEHLLLKRPCALKVIRPDRRIDETTIARFEAEVRATAQLSHPNTVEIYDFGLANDGTWYYVMELLRGMNLDELVQSHGPLLPERVVYLLRQACGSLGEAHAAGLVHRDIKPSNLFAAERGGMRDFVKVLDFGLVRGSNAEPVADEDSFGGSPHFMAPEQFSSYDAVDARCDIYALGAVAYFLLIGRPPFGGRWIKELRDAHAHQAVTRPSLLRPSVPADLESVILRCLAKAPTDRYPSADSLAAALGSCQCAEEWTQQQARQWWHEHPRGISPGKCDGVETLS